MPADFTQPSLQIILRINLDGTMALPDMDADMRPLAEQTIHKLHNMTDAAFEEAQFTMTLSDTE